MLKEYLFRAVQHLLGSFVFDAPLLSDLKTNILRRFIDIGRGSYVSYSTVFVSPHSQTRAYLRIGNNVAIEHSCFLDYSGGISIGDHVWISEGVFIGTHGHRIRNRSLKKMQPTVHEPLEIGKDAWIGAGAIILDKVRVIGEGAIVGAGAVVTKDVENWAIVAGNPARVVGWRESDSRDDR